MSPTPQLSIVIPVLNEEANLPELFRRLFGTLEGLELSYEVLIVDDGSTDSSLELVRAEQRTRPQLRSLPFVRNFGQHAAVMAGFEGARGEWIVTLDADLQNPPEEVAKLVEAFRAGHDLVNTVRQGRDDPLFRKLASRAVNSLARRCSGIQLNDFGCMLRGYHRDLIVPMTRRREFGTFIPALAMLYARNPVEIPVAHAPRTEGDSKYSLLKLFRLQLDLVTSFSLSPLRALFGFGVATALLGIGFGLVLFALRLIYGPEWAVDGVFTLFAVLFVFVGAQFFAFGLLGEYIGRIYQEVRERPPFLLAEPAVEAPAEAPAAAEDEAPAPAESARAEVEHPVGTP
ncbi:MAG: glycosyltransferase [Planctomycetes bacterium]|nr:glycosyltransferase [Planctomycetota bacterium]